MYCRRVAIANKENGNSLALSLMVIGLLIFIAGCGFAVYRQQEVERETELEKDLGGMVNDILTDHSSGSGALSLTLLASSTMRLEKDRSAHVHVETMDGDVLDLYLPDMETFLEMKDENSPTTTRTIPVATEDGRVLPGKMEVTLNG